MVEIRLRPLVSKNVLKMVGSKRPTIFPLRVTNAIPFANGYPTMAADRLSSPSVRLLEPGDHQRRFWLELTVRDVVIRQREVERILLRDKRDWYVIPARARLWTVRAAVIRRPIEIPATLVVRYRIVSARFFPHPKHGGDDIHFPRIPLDSRSRTRRDKHLRFHFDQRLFPQLHRVLREICCGGVRRSGLFVPEDFRGASNCKTETNRDKSLHADRRSFYRISSPEASSKFPTP